MVAGIPLPRPPFMVRWAEVVVLCSEKNQQKNSKTQQASTNQYLQVNKSVTHCSSTDSYAWQQIQFSLKNTSPKTKMTMEQLNNHHLKIEYISYQQKMMIFQLAMLDSGRNSAKPWCFFQKKIPPGHRRTRPRSSRLGLRRWWHDLPTRWDP